jgi:hypothetical protein
LFIRRLYYNYVELLLEALAKLGDPNWLNNAHPVMPLLLLLLLSLLLMFLLEMANVPHNNDAAVLVLLLVGCLMSLCLFLWVPL